MTCQTPETGSWPDCHTGDGCEGWSTCRLRQRVPAQWGKVPSTGCCAAAAPGPSPITPLSVAAGTIGGAGAVCEQPKVGGRGPLWQ